MQNVGTVNIGEAGENGEGRRLKGHAPGWMSSGGDARRRSNWLESAGRKGRNSGRERKWL